MVSVRLGCTFPCAKSCATLSNPRGKISAAHVILSPFLVHPPLPWSQPCRIVELRLTKFEFLDLVLVGGGEDGDPMQLVVDWHETFGVMLRGCAQVVKLLVGRVFAVEFNHVDMEKVTFGYRFSFLRLQPRQCSFHNPLLHLFLPYAFFIHVARSILRSITGLPVHKRLVPGQTILHEWMRTALVYWIKEL